MVNANVNIMSKDENATLLSLVSAFQHSININSKQKTHFWKMVKKFDMALTSINFPTILFVAMLNYLISR